MSREKLETLYHLERLDGVFEEPSPKEFARLFALRRYVKILFPKTAGGKVILTRINRHTQKHFWVAGVEDLYIPSGSICQVILVDDEAVYVFATHFVCFDSKSSMGLKTMMIFDRPATIKRIQRRRDVRVPIRTPLTLRTEERPERVVNGETVNLSSSGLLLASESEMANGMEFDLRLALKDTEQSFLLRVRARVVHHHQKTALERRSMGKMEFGYMHGCMFIDPDQDDKDQLALFLLKRQKDFVT